ncbi:hypothetical protein DY120_00225 [Apilactobacillus micheneri]|uniref:Uncharacterized protein n=1 Tax=Apilactobacillus micheneri TaxID=1899430 RepID=A0ABY2Z034_9LACO|nr:hypothetical protein [Apilactobacillus micheneri]TPR26159.1 hypothetical protein DY114_00225 [Apilactobacillus micheneri]TPR26913.1 hypothetical protein DY111_00225 [Apilactobacillus micheneri]TPR27771.1 hypothetical protein DY113_04000 [Apilactobacillus micheneri]TPR31676.1 hypothetical protein DY117_00225 [Apilactobacillus micheneri]TPR32080.1 hypothetical protein DY120_00225 [Apilactobacillus micheneri]
MKANMSLNEFKNLMKTPKAKKDMDEITNEIFFNFKNVSNEFKIIEDINKSTYSYKKHIYDSYKGNNFRDFSVFNKRDILEEFKSIKNSEISSKLNELDYYNNSYSFDEKSGCIV